MNLSDALNIKSIAINAEVENKAALIELLIDLADKTGKIINKEEAKKETFKREAIMSTGIGKGIALPHAKTNSVTDTICALAILKNPIDFDSMDGEPVKLALMLLGKENAVGAHLRLLSRISRLLGDEALKQKLFDSQTPQEAFEIILSNEE
jgi:fructose-specific phosphotransferase system IIA component